MNVDKGRRLFAPSERLTELKRSLRLFLIHNIAVAGKMVTTQRSCNTALEREPLTPRCPNCAKHKNSGPVLDGLRTLDSAHMLSKAP